MIGMGKVDHFHHHLPWNKARCATFPKSGACCRLFVAVCHITNWCTVNYFNTSVRLFSLFVIQGQFIPYYTYVFGLFLKALH